VFRPGSDPVKHTITDFDVFQDKIDIRAFSGVGADNVGSWLVTHATQPANSSDTLLTLDPNDQILLKNVLPSSLHSSDFIVSPHSSSGTA